MKTILMNAGRTKDILDGRKTQTRRVIMDIPTYLHNGTPIMEWGLSAVHFDSFNGKELHYKVQTHVDDSARYIARPKYQIDDILWVREPAIVHNTWLGDDGKYRMQCEYLADNKFIVIEQPERFRTSSWANSFGDKRSGIPNGCIKEMARIFLKITNVRVERLQDISCEDTMAEGCNLDISAMHIEGVPQSEAIIWNVEGWYMKLWDSTAPKGFKWENNPYVFVYDFERVEKDQGRSE